MSSSSSTHAQIIDLPAVLLEELERLRREKVEAERHETSASMLALGARGDFEQLLLEDRRIVAARRASLHQQVGGMSQSEETDGDYGEHVMRMVNVLPSVVIDL